MNQETTKKLAALDIQIKEMKAAGNQAGVAAAHSQKALLYAMSMDLKAAAAEVAKASIIAQEEGRVEELALAHYAQAKALINIPNKQDEAKSLFEKAIALYHVMDNKLQQAKILQALSTINLTQENVTEAIKQLDEAIDLLDPTDNLEFIVDLLKARANTYIFEGNIKKGLKDLDTALNLAEQYQNQELILAIRLQQQTIKALTPQGASNEDLSTLLKDARQAGNFQIAGDVQLQQANIALQGGDYNNAYNQAEQVRLDIMKSTDLMRHGRFLSASIIMATAMEKLENHRLVLYALLSCKSYLETNIGKAVGQQVNQILNSLQERWGNETMKKAIDDYQTWFKQQKKQ